MERELNFQRQTLSQKQSDINNKDPSFYSNNFNPLAQHNANDAAIYDYHDDSAKLEFDCNYSKGSFKKAVAPQSPIPNQLHKTANYIPESQQDLIPHAFDLHDVIQKYGDHPEVLGLILSSKVEEDRRKAEEARLRQKELEYLILSKRDSISSQPYTRRNSSGYNDPYETTKMMPNNKGKAKQSLINYDNEQPRSSPKDTVQSPYANAKYTQTKNDQEPSRKRDANTSYQLSDTSDYFSSSYLSVAQPESSTFREKRHGSINQLLSPNKSVESATDRQLQTLDFLYSRRDSNNYAPTAPRSPFEEKPYINTLGKNTLPPINVSLQSHGRNEKASTSNSANLPRDASSSVNRSKRFKQIPTLDSFEASILETLPFDNASHRSSCSSESLQDERRSSAPIDKYSINDKSPSITSQQRSISLDDNSNRFQQNNINMNSSSNMPKKLLLPPNNRPSKQSCPDLTNRPRRRRREMQAISMIIETREFPYNDEYVWKNNGNTIHKSTGQKSIYYKCSNSMMGCPVNKTVTFRENGEYLIKYRGNHLKDCNKIKRVVNI